MNVNAEWSDLKYLVAFLYSTSFRRMVRLLKRDVGIGLYSKEKTVIRNAVMAIKEIPKSRCCAKTVWK